MPPGPAVQASVRAAVRAYLASEWVVRRGSAAAKTLLDAFWLGVLGQQALHEIDASYYHGRSEYLNAGYNTRGLFGWEGQVVQKYFSGRKKVIVTGAGGGREIVALAHLGFDIQGFECNPRLLTAGRALLEAQKLPATLDLMPRDEWPAEATQAEAIIVGWGSHMLIRGASRRVQFLRQARATLKVGYPILLSFFLRLSDTSYFRLVKRIGNFIARASGNAALVEMGDALVPNFAHHFTMAEISEELAAAGFALTESGTDPYGWAVGLAR